MLNSRERERLLAQLGGLPRRRRSPARVIFSNISWEIVAGFLIVLGFLGFVLWQAQDKAVGPATFAFVVVGWVFSLCLHEFAHAATAVLGGDDSDSTERYLSFNPLHYVNPVFSIILPLLFVLIGGIGLPGGAVYLRRDLVRNRYWQSAISLAGPAMNLLFAGVLGVGYHFAFQSAHFALAAALAVLALFQVAGVLLNLLPIPPLDGFGAISYWLPTDLRLAGYQFGYYGVLIVFLLLDFIPAVNTAFFELVFRVLGLLHIDALLADLGYAAFFFWRH